MTNASPASTNTAEAGTTVDLDELCRLCLNRTDPENAIGIFKNDEKSSLSVRIMACSALEVQENDGLPTTICLDCRQLLEKFYYFRKKSKNSDTKLRRHLRLINAGKPSKVFETAGGEDDEHEDDYIESRELFAKWDEQRRVEEKRLNDEPDKNVNDQLERAVEHVREHETKRIFEEARKHLMDEMAIKAKAEQKVAKVQAALQAALQQTAPPVAPESVRLEVQELIVADETVETEFCDADEELLEDVDDLQDDADNLDDNSYEIIEIVEECDVKNENVDNMEIDQADDDENEILSNDGNEEEFKVDEAKSEIYQQAEYLEEADESVADVSTIDDYKQVEDDVDSELTEAQILRITESIRDSIQATTGISMSNEFQYTILERHLNMPSKVEVTTSKGVVIEVALNCELDENGEKKIFHCKLCPLSFTRRIQLTRHVSVHENRQGLSCDFCRKWFPSKSSLSRHFRIHTGEKPFKCTECDRSFIQKEILKRHMMIHTGERPFACGFCDKSFTQREFLRQHVNRQHTENPIIKMHKCPKCPKTFFHASGLSRHILIHSGRKFDCSECGKSFSDKSALNRHKVSLHGS